MYEIEYFDWLIDWLIDWFKFSYFILFYFILLFFVIIFFFCFSILVLMAAASRGDLLLFNYLLSLGANPNAK